MTRTLFRVAIAVALIGAGWSVGRAQTNVADFEVTIDAPGWETTIECHKGWDFTNDVGRVVGPSPHTNFRFHCNAPRCGATINGAGHVPHQ
jgi:hypothetical protein